MVAVINGGGQRPRRRPSLALIPPAAPAPPIYEVMGDHGSPPGPLPASHCHWDIVGGCLSISMWQETLTCGQRPLFCHKRYFVPRKRFKWDKSALQVCFVPIKRFIPHEIAEHPAGGGLMAVAYHGDGRR